jgi:hypothetical protein
MKNRDDLTGDSALPSFHQLGAGGMAQVYRPRFQVIELAD